jgi:hypothetical protein
VKQQELDDLEKMLAVIPPAPWTVDRSPGDMEVGVPDQLDVTAPNGDHLFAMFPWDASQAENLAKATAALRNAAADLISAARENARLRAVVEAARDVHRAFFVNTYGELRFVSLESATATVCRLDDALSALDAKGQP